MEGKRFGFGLLAGLFVALVVVGVTGGFGSLSTTGSFSPAAYNVASSTVQSAVSTVTETMISTSTVPPATTGSSSYPVPPNGTSGLAAVSTTVASSTSSGAPHGSLSGTTGVSVPGPTYSSRVESMAQQPFLSNAVILVPVLVAFLLAAFLYRLSVRNREQPGS